MTHPDTMTAIAIREPGGPDVLIPEIVPVPRPGTGEVLIKVDAAGVNRPDCLQRSGLYPVPADASPLPGLEVAGNVVAHGPGADSLPSGARVCALVHGGGYAEYCVANESHCLPVEGELGIVEAAALPETLFTVYYNLVTRCQLRASDTLLVHGGSSGIGSTAIQLAKAMGSRVITTAGSDEKCRYCENLGADLAINYKTTDFVAAIREKFSGVDVVLDMVGGDYIGKNLALLNRDGRYAFIAFLGGATARVNFVDVLRNRLTLTGSTLRPQSVAEKAQIARDIQENVWQMFLTGQIKPHIFRRFDLTEAAAAHALMESSAHMGKIILIPNLAKR